MAQAKNAANKGKGAVRKLDGKVVRPVLYNGRALGHGKYFTGDVDGVIVCDESGKPLLLKEIGAVE